jgi:hypothetical protein
MEFNIQAIYKTMFPIKLKTNEACKNEKKAIYSPETTSNKTLYSENGKNIPGKYEEYVPITPYHPPMYAKKK